MRLRMTNQREIILRELKKSGKHLSADELYERVKRTMPRISLATVYRILEKLSEAGIISKLEVGGRQKRFDTDVTDHDHIHCVRCQRVDNLHISKEKILPLQSVAGYTITGYKMEFVGLCEKCQKKENQRRK